ncbi:pantoate--beta-alanine ligase, partial [Porphyromonas loveana]
HTPEMVIQWVTRELSALPHLRVEYFEIVDGHTLQSICNWEDTDYAVGCITVFCGEVRLIDNIKYED